MRKHIGGLGSGTGSEKHWMTTDSNAGRHLWLGLLTAHIASGLHLAVLVEWSMIDFVQFMPPSAEQRRSQEWLGRILSVTQFPVFHLEQFLGYTPSVVCSLCLGYGGGLVLGYFAGRRVLRWSWSSLLWWFVAGIAVVESVSCWLFIPLPKWTVSTLLNSQLVLVPSTLIASLGLWLLQRRGRQRA